MIKAIVFDVDDTLYDQTQPFLNAFDDIFGPDTGLSVLDVYAASRRHSDAVYAAWRSGKMSTRAMTNYRMTQAFKDFGRALDEDTAARFQEAYAGYQARLEMSEGMKNLLGALSGRYPIGIITNGPSAHQWQKVRALGLERYMPAAHIIASGDVGTEKPDPVIFREMAARLGVRPEEMLYIGDNYDNDVAGAEGAGCAALWFNRHHEPTCGRACVQSEDALVRELTKRFLT